MAADPAAVPPAGRPGGARPDAARTSAEAGTTATAGAAGAAVGPTAGAGPVPDGSAAVRTADGAVLAARVQGPPDAPVTLVLAHGWTQDSSSWDPQADALAAPGGAAVPIRVVRYDQRGHGGSGGGTAPWSVDLLGEDLAAVLEQLAPTGPVVLGGHSMGGMTVMALAAGRPELFGDRIRGVLLTCTSAGGLDLADRQDLPRRVRLVNRAERALFARAAADPGRAARVRDRLPRPENPLSLALHRRLLFGPDAPRAAVLHTARMMRSCPMAAFAGWFQPLMHHDKGDGLAALGRVPVEILAGTLDRLTPVPHARRLAAAVPGARLHIEPRTGHMLHLEQPVPVVLRLRALCERAADVTD